MPRLFHAAAWGMMALDAACALQSQEPAGSPWTVSGYYRNLYTRSRTVVPPTQEFALDLSRLRLKLNGKPLASIAVEVQYDNELLLGSYVKTAQYALMMARVETSFDLQHEYVARDALVARHSLYRATATWSGASTDVRIGRQRIPLGTGFFWSPMDLLNPIDPARLERDFRTGADAVLVEQRLSALGRVAAMYVPSTHRLKSVGAGYVHGNVRSVDYSVVLGNFRGDRALGIDFSSNVGGLGLRGEATATRPSEGPQFARGLLGADYGLANSLDVTVEAYYNGRGASGPRRYDLNGFLAGRVLNLARWYGAVALKYELTPLVTLAAYAVSNMDDGSRVLWPNIEWSVRANIDLVVGIQRFSGPDESEYGRASNLVHGEARWYF